MSGTAPPNVPWTLLSDTAGKIVEIAVQIRQLYFETPERKLAYEHLLKALTGRGVKVVVMTSEALDTPVQQWLQKIGLQNYQIVIAPTQPFNDGRVWARDAFLCATSTNGGGRVHLRPHVSKVGDFATWLSAHAQASVHPLPIGLDGGDSLLHGNDHWIVGAGAVKFTIAVKNNAIDWNGAVQHMNDAVGPRPIVAGYRPGDVSNKLQWLLPRVRDLTLQNVGLPQRKQFRYAPRRLLVRGWALTRVVRDLFSSSVDQLSKDWVHIDLVVSATGATSNANKPIVLVASPMAEGCPPSSTAISKEGILSALTKELVRQGLDVIRNPAPYAKPDPQWGGEPILLPYNNTIVQTEPDKVVWLPVFAGSSPDFQATDDENTRIWQSLGFQVVPVPGWAVFASEGGSIRCATMVLKRQ